ncbi:hypothetical protein HQ587_01290 [bacterium]|nr:hypothetical protein [bacterium]
MRITILLITSICVALTAGADLFAQDAENVEQVGRIYNQWDNAWDVVVVDGLAYVAAGCSGLQIVDVSDPENPVVVGYWEYINEACGVAVSDEYAYVADGGIWNEDEFGYVGGGLRVISVDDPEHPEEVGYYNTPGRAEGVTVSGDYAYVADGGGSLRVISVADPEQPEEVGFCDTPG